MMDTGPYLLFPKPHKALLIRRLYFLGSSWSLDDIIIRHCHGALALNSLELSGSYDLHGKNSDEIPGLQHSKWTGFITSKAVS